MIRELILAIATLAAQQSRAASRPFEKIEARGPSEPVELGAPFPLTVTRRYKTNDPPPWNATILAPLTVEERGVERRAEGNETIETRTFEARAFAQEEVNIPELGFRARVKSVLPEPAGAVEPPPGPFPMPFEWRRFLITALCMFAGMVAALAGFLWYRNRPRAVPPPPPPIPADERALARLASLRNKTVSTESEIQQFYVEVSSIVRDYVEERIGVRAPEMTTEEFLSSPDTNEKLAPGHRELLSQFLLHCDLVKFAKQSSSARDREQLCGAAERFVQETR